MSKNIVLGVTGSIAAHKAADLASLLTKQKCQVRVVLTADAQRFITPLPFKTLSRNPVITDLYDEEEGWKPTHIRLADEADLLSRVPGVGKKTAQKMALHLKDKLKPTDGLSKLAAISDTDSEVLAALTALGYSVVEAQAAIQSIPKDAPDDTEERLRYALGYFQ